MTAETTDSKVEQFHGSPVADLSAAPLPTPQTLKARQAIIPQLLKFVGFDLTIMRMVLKGHSHD